MYRSVWWCVIQFLKHFGIAAKSSPQMPKFYSGSLLMFSELQYDLY